jgi:hypothetical protein
MPSNENTVYIVPALTDMAGQCRIVMAQGRHANARDAYRARPQDWREIGIMSSRGHVVCIDADASFVQELKDSEPLMAGVTFFV